VFVKPKKTCKQKYSQHSNKIGIRETLFVNNVAWGTKRSCPKCAAHFYDLNKNPTACPKCKYTYDPTIVVRARRGRTRKSADIPDVQEKIVPIQPNAILEKKKKAAHKKASEDALAGFGDVEVEAGGDDIEEVEGEELESLEQMEDEKASGDDADDESIMEDLEEMESSGTVIVDKIEDDEDEEEDDDLADEDDDDDDEEEKPKRKKTVNKKAKK
jgi:hypothetical protein